MQLTRTQISRLVGEPYFSRGQEYCTKQSIQFVSITDTLVKAKVFGSRFYQVKLMSNGPNLDGKCSCPAFLDFGPCKHIAATGFALLKYNQGNYKSSPEFDKTTEERNDLIKILKQKTKPELIDIIEALYDNYPEIIDEI